MVMIPYDRPMAHVTTIGRYSFEDDTINTLEEYERRAALVMLWNVPLINSWEFVAVQVILDTNNLTLSELLGVSEVTVSRWLNGRRTFGRTVQLALIPLLQKKTKIQPSWRKRFISKATKRAFDIPIEPRKPKVGPTNYVVGPDTLP